VRQVRSRWSIDAMSNVTSSSTPARERTSLLVPDLSSFAQSLRSQLAARLLHREGPPGHVEMLNLLARAAGHRNVQALQAAARRATSRPDETAAVRWHGPRDPLLTPTADRVLRNVDTMGRLLRWPHKRAEQVLALWCVWMAFDGKRRYSEREVNEVINRCHAFGDHCLLRRELVEADLLARTPGGEQYRKLPARPSDEAAALLRAVRRRAQG
jgi:hypothetical protein